MIETNIRQSVDAGETDVATSKMVVVDMHYPPLWRRGGELVQQLLETQGFNSVPNKLMSSDDAHERFRELNRANNINFPAIFDF